MVDNCIWHRNMAEEFNIKKGIAKSLKTALQNDSFISAVFSMLSGEKGAEKDVEYGLKSAAQENTLNEVVSVHRLYKHGLSENAIINLASVPKELTERLLDIRKKSTKFQREVLVRTLKKPGMFKRFVYIIKSLCTAGYPIDDVIATPMAIKFITALVETATEIAKEDEETEVAINEAVVLEKIRRAFRHGSRSRSVLSEEFEDKYGGRMPVNVYTGRFQPFHLGHLSNLEEAAKRGLRTVICPVMKGKTTKPEDHPFDAIDNEILQRIKSAYGDLVVDVIPIKNAFVESWVNPLREAGYEPITWTTGMDRKPAYDAMIEKYKDKYGLVDNFEVIGLAKDVDAEGGSADDTSGISGTAVRKCLVNGDEEGFRRQMPKCLWDMYPAMREIMQQYTQPAITESEAYAKYKKYLNEKIEKLLNEK